MWNLVPFCKSLPKSYGLHAPFCQKIQNILKAHSSPSHHSKFKTKGERCIIEVKKIMIYQSIEMKKDYQLSDILAYHMQVLGMDLQLFPSSWYLKILEHYVVVMCDLLLCFGGNGNHLFCHNNVWQKGWDKLFPSTLSLVFLLFTMCLFCGFI